MMTGNSWSCRRLFSTSLRRVSNDLGIVVVMLPNVRIMDRVIVLVADGLERFEQWFNDRFGWFFTNGMKRPRVDGSSVIKASRTRSSLR